MCPIGARLKTMGSFVSIEVLLCSSRTARVAQQHCRFRAIWAYLEALISIECYENSFCLPKCQTRTRTNTNPNGTEANAAGRSGNARALRKQSKCGMIQEGERHWPISSENLQKARNLWVLRTPQNNKEEGARAKKLVTCGTRGPLGRVQSVPFSAQGAYCSAPEP